MMCYADDPEQAAIRAVNDTKDNDAIVSEAALWAFYRSDTFGSGPEMLDFPEKRPFIAGATRITGPLCAVLRWVGWIQGLSAGTESHRLRHVSLEGNEDTRGATHVTEVSTMQIWR